VAFTSVSHFGFMVLGIFALTTQSISGTIFYMVNHGFSTAVLFLVVGYLAKRRGSVEITSFGGVFQVAPVLAGMFLLGGLASLSLPGMGSFVGEFLVLAGTWSRYPIIAAVGTLGTMNMLGLARAKGATFLLASTSEIYGDPLVHPQPESYWGNVNTIGPRGCYDEAKRCAEAFAMAYHRAHALDTRIIRIFNTHGPRMQVSDGRAVPNFMAQAIRGEPLTVYGDGTQTRSLCYVSDLVRGVLAVLERGDEMPVNLGNPHEVTVLELAKTIVRLAHSKSEIVHRELPVDDPKQRRPDITHARALLGWEPQVSLEDGLSRTLEYFRSVV